MNLSISVLATVSAAVLAGSAASAEEKISRSIDFNREIRPILSNACFSCHGPDANKRKGVNHPLRLDTAEGAFADLGGYAAIVRGKPAESEIINRIRSDDPNEIMPPPSHAKRLSPTEVDRLSAWVEQGAAYARHWSYVKPSPPALPKVRDQSWPKNAIDRFILARLESEGLAPSPEADRAALIRRVSLDLTGLPPTLEEVETFIHDRLTEAYERLVDRLLAKPSYGEHWGRLWLDLARYADSAGYADDPARTIWAYRDYVIRSFNANKPFDQFTIEQIAGDLLPSPTEDQSIATAFHRNTLTNNEGGTIDEEFRNVAVIDRVNTTMAVWMGTTMACAQCHDHKYDPLSQADYFRFFAFFNNTEDADRTDESPLLKVYSMAQKRQKADWQNEAAKLESTLRTTSTTLLADHYRRKAAVATAWVWTTRTPEMVVETLKRFGDRRGETQRAKSTKPILVTLARMASLKSQLAGMKPETTVPILRERGQGARRITKLQRRGNYLDLGEEVVEGVPAVFAPLSANASRDRLTLARWLVGSDNPLTARVVANRYWEQIFGVGIVATSEEFGAQGDLPSHPELLDWLAANLVETRWDLKRFLRLLVTSATYRQVSRVTPEQTQRDPDNRLLGRGPRVRLSAEAVRDQALAVSGLLSPKMFGPPVKPPQPSAGLSAAFGGSVDWAASKGEDRFRRGIYTLWRRSSPYPSMATFDAPNREVCTLRRTRTNTPLQALVTLNDPVYVEAAQALARRIAASGATPADRVRHGFRLCLARHPTDEETARLVRLYETTRATFANDPTQARQMATEPIGAAPKDADVAGLAAWTVVGNVLLNLDEMLMKR